MSDLVDARLSVQRDLSRALASARQVREAAPSILDAISGRLGCAASEMWLVDDARSALVCVGTWAGEERARSFVASSTSFEFSRGQGLPGGAWERATPQWMTDVSADAAFERNVTALASGLHAAVAFPILFGGDVTGVVQFFYPEERQADTLMMETFADIGEQLGLFLERARIDAITQRQAAEILELSAPILRVAPDAVLLPIIGSFDAGRAVHVTERLLTRVSELGARCVVFDLTNAGTMDTFMARRLLDAVAAVKLLGASAIVTGVQPAAARTMVLLGVQLGDIEVRASLADGLTLLRERGSRPAPAAPA